MIGQRRIKTFIHPDSIGVRVWDVQELTLATGKYAKPGQTCWKSLTLEPFTSEADATAFKEQDQC